MSDLHSLHLQQQNISLNLGIRRCLTRPILGRADFQIVSGPDGPRARVLGLNTCQNKSCIYCSQRRQAKEAQKLSEYLPKILSKHQALFTTLTVGSYAFDDAAEHLEKLKNAWRSFANGTFFKKSGIIGFYRTTEDPIDPDSGKQHVHNHILFVLEEGREVDPALISKIHLRWIKFAKKHGVSAYSSLQKSIPVTADNGLSTYLSKHGSNNISLEMTLSNQKQGKNLNLPQLVALIADTPPGKEKNRLISVYRRFEKLRAEHQYRTRSNNFFKLCEASTASEEVDAESEEAEEEIIYSQKVGKLVLEIIAEKKVRARIFRELLKSERFRKVFSYVCDEEPYYLHPADRASEKARLKLLLAQSLAIMDAQTKRASLSVHAA